MRRLPLAGLSLAAAVLSVTCKSDGGSGGGPVPTTITISPNPLSFNALGSTQALVATVRDQNGAVMAGVTLTWSTDNAAVVAVSNLGVATAAGNGSTTIRATATATGGAQGTVGATVAQAAASITKVQGDNLTAVIGDTTALRLVVEVKDANSNPVPSLNVAFAVSQGGGAVGVSSQATGANGRNSGVTWTMGAVGPQQVTATVTGMAPVTFSATAITQLGTVALYQGNSQTGLQAFALNVRPAVIVQDLASAPVAGVQVQFAVTGGGGSVQGGTAVSDANGVARVGNWIVQNGSNTLRASVTTPGYSGGPVNFTATGVPSTYNITLRFLTAVTPSQQAAFTTSAGRWQQLIFQDVPDIDATGFPAGACGANSPALSEIVDDILIFVTIEPIDGPGNTLGSAGTCAVRTLGGLPAIGRMRFDSADVAFLESTGQFGLLMLHETGHVLGYGTRWSAFGLLADPSQSGGTDPHFTGATAIAKFDELGGAGYVLGAKVPVENSGGATTADGHWRESVFDTELMTGFLDSGVPNPLSAISTASMGDLGYTVSYGASDVFTVPTTAALRAAAGAKLFLGDDIERLPIWVLDASGRVVRVVQP